MYKGETYWGIVIFANITIFKILTPPVYSLERLEKHCRSWIKKYPMAYSPRWFLAQLYKDYKKNEEAKKEYEEIQLLGYMTDKDRIDFGEVLFRLENYQGAIQTLISVIDKYPRHKNANYFLGINYMKKEEFEKASVYLEKVILAGSRRYEDYWHLGFCFGNSGQLEKAREAYQNALILKPDSIELKKNLESIQMRIKRSS